MNEKLIIYCLEWNLFLLRNNLNDVKNSDIEFLILRLKPFNPVKALDFKFIFNRVKYPLIETPLFLYNKEQNNK